MRSTDGSVAARLCGAAFVAAALLPHLEASGPTLRDVLAKAGAYSVQAGRDLAAVVADEAYLQQLIVRANGEVFETRRLDSEIAFVVLDDGLWLAFRMVGGIDGKDVGSDPGWLERLFREGRRSAVESASRIAAEGARYNLGGLQRTVNFPTLVQQFLLPNHQPRFRFAKKREELAGADRVWVIEYKEESRGTIIRTALGEPVPARGLIWVDPSSGRLHRATLDLEKPVPTEIEFSWRLDSKLALWVPAEMRERYRTRLLHWVQALKRFEPYDIRGVATYSNYRRFQADYRIK